MLNGGFLMVSNYRGRHNSIGINSYSHSKQVLVIMTYSLCPPQLVKDADKLYKSYVFDYIISSPISGSDSISLHKGYP